MQFYVLNASILPHPSKLRCNLIKTNAIGVLHRCTYIIITITHSHLHLNKQDKSDCVKCDQTIAEKYAYALHFLALNNNAYGVIALKGYFIFFMALDKN